MLVARQRVEFLDAGLHVVAKHTLARGDRGQVDVLEHPLVVRHHTVGYIDAQLGLRHQHRQPQPPLGDDLGLRRPDRHHLVAGIPTGQHIRDRHKHTAYDGG
jgi:hypothetical protein